jgi:heptosyltransferase-1
MKLAIVKLSALGDIIHAMIALQFLKANNPNLTIDWIVEQNFAEILKYNPDITNIRTINLKGLKKNKLGIFQQIQQIKHYAKADYDLVIDAQGLIKSAITARLLGNTVVGFDKQSIRESLASYFYNQKIACAYDENTIIRNLEVITKPFDITITQEQILNKQPFLFFKAENPVINDFLSVTKRNIVLVISSTWESRNYPTNKFIEVADALKENCLVVWGNEAERVKAETMAMQSAYIQVMPALDLNSLKALIAKADLVIGNDTGPTHIAWGLNKPSITLFGCTPISRVYQTDINKVLKSSSLVNPYKLNKQDYSINEIETQAVVNLVQNLFAL